MNQKSILVAAACLSSFFAAFMSNSLNVAIPAISHTYGISPQSVPLAISVYVITVTAFIFPSIALANRFGFRNIFAFGSLTSAIASFLAPLAPHFYIFLALRSLQGIFNATIFCTSMALLTYHIEKEKRGYYIGLNIAAVYAGLSLSPTLGGVITDTIGWSFMFYLTALGNLGAYLLLLKIPKEPAVSQGYPKIRMFICTLSFIAIFSGISFINDSDYALYILLLGCATFTYYIILEKHSKKPLLPINLLLDNKVLSFSLLASLCNYTATFAVSMLLSMHLQLILHISASQTGLILIITPICQCLLSPFAGKMVSKISPHALVFSGMLLSTIATLIYANIKIDTPLYIINIAQVLGGIGFGLFSSPNTTLVMSSVDKTKLALVNGLQALSRNLGMSTCMAFVTLVIATFLNVTPESDIYAKELNYTVNISFAISTIIGVAGLIFCLAGAYFYKKQHINLFN